MKRPVLILGAVAIASLLGGLQVLPATAAFFIGAIAIALFPGLAVGALLGLDRIKSWSLPARLALGFGLGAGILTYAGFAASLIYLRITHMAVLLAVGYTVLMALVVLQKAGWRDSSHGMQPCEKCTRPVVAVVICLAIAAGLLTLVTPRDDDDWYYLGYINDYAGGHQLALEDAFVGGEQPASTRAWFGGWWAVEALMARVSGAEPVDAHQIYFPLLIVPFSVMAIFALGCVLFSSCRTALLGCCFQVLYLVSSAFPTKNAGYMFLCRTAQDKAVSLLIMVPVALALGLIILRPRSRPNLSGYGRLFVLFLLVTVGSTLVHPYGAIWCGVALIPFMLVELVFRRTRRFALAVLIVLVVFLVCGSYLLLGRRILEASYEDLQKPRIMRWMEEPIRGFYWPGQPFPAKVPAPAAGPGAAVEPFRLVKTSYVTRYPLALAGALLTLLLIPSARSRFDSRFLVCMTLSVAALSYTPLAVSVTARIMTYRMAYRMTWLFPWGLSIALFISILKRRWVWSWLAVVAVFFLVARGNPYNYVKALVEVRSDGRPSPAVVEAIRVLRTQPPPRGDVLATEETGKFIAAFDPDASPAFYRGEGPIAGDRVREITGMFQPDTSLVEELETGRIRYVLLERGLPLAAALRRGWTNLPLLYANDSYLLWEVPSHITLSPPRRPGPNLIVITITGLRRDRVGAYGSMGQATPNIDSLAAHGVVFENAASPSPQTLPAHASIFTGVYPRVHGAISNSSVLGEDYPTLADAMRERDYLTGAFVSSHDLTDSCGLARGFDWYWNLNDKFNLTQIRAMHERGEDRVTDLATEKITQYAASSFFYWIQWSHPQRPYLPPAGYRRSGAVATGSIPYWQRDARPLSVPEVKQVIGLYEGEVGFADRQVGRVVAELEELGLLDDTIIVIAADHGEILYDRDDYFGSDIEVYDETMMVPWIIYAPGITAEPARIKHLVSALNIMPTMLSILDEHELSGPEGGASPGLEGGGLVSAIDEDVLNGVGHVFAETFPEMNAFPPRHAVRTEDYKLIWKETGTDYMVKEFYDLRADPGEELNIYSSGNRMAARLDTVLGDWVSEGGLHPYAIPAPRRGGRFRILRSLGYLD